jgi:hypothetical protein
MKHLLSDYYYYYYYCYYSLRISLLFIYLFAMYLLFFNYLYVYLQSVCFPFLSHFSRSSTTAVFFVPIHLCIISFLLPV